MKFTDQETGKEVWVNPANIVLLYETDNGTQVTVQTPTFNNTIMSAVGISELIKRLELSKCTA